MPNVNGYTTKRKPHRVRPHFRVVNRMTGAFREGSFDTKAEAREAARAQNRTFGAGWVVEREGRWRTPTPSRRLVLGRGSYYP